MAQKELSERLKTLTTPVPKELFSKLITANHILHYNKVVDAYGHISVRNPSNPKTFFLSASVAPALVSSLDDLVEYNVEDASAVKSDSPRGYLERYIHSEIFKKYPGVNSVIHSHAESVIPFSVTSLPLRPIFHMGGVMGAQVPVYDIANHYNSSDTRHDLLIGNQHLGASLATGFSPSTMLGKTTNVLKSFVSSPKSVGPEYPTHPTVLMRGHGFTCVGSTIEEAVYRAVYTCTNARVQTTSLLLQAGYNTSMIVDRMGKEDAGKAQPESVKFLDDREVKDAWEANATQASRPWKLWVAEVECTALYRNQLEEIEDEDEEEGEE